MESHNKPNDSLIDAHLPNYRKQLGRYSLYYVLGRGGMASVYLSRMLGEGGFERWVAVKKIHEHLQNEVEMQQMFLDEARTAARLQHPNLVHVTDFGEQSGESYLVMEYIVGETLSSLLRNCRRNNKPLSIPLGARIVASMCNGLYYAHNLRDTNGEALNLIHRDVTPQNVLITYDGGVKVTDFGIAMASDRLQKQTQTGKIKGKLAYMSPEQVLGRTLDFRSDVFALGIILFETTLGRRLFKSDTDFETLQRITTSDVPLPRNINPKYPRALEQIVLKALQKKPENRFQSAQAMQREIEKYLSTVGYPIGTMEISDMMKSVFSRRLKVREEMMTAVENNELFGLEIELFPPQNPGANISDSLSFPDADFKEPPSNLRLWQGLFGVALCIILVLVCVVIGFIFFPIGDTKDLQTHRSLANRTEVQSSLEFDKIFSQKKNHNNLAEAEEKEFEIIVGSHDTSQHAEDTAGNAESKRHRTSQKNSSETKSAPGTMSVIAQPWCDVYMGGRKIGRTPIIQVKVPSGRRTLRFFPYGKRPYKTRRVRIYPEKNTAVSVNFLDEPTHL